MSLNEKLEQKLRPHAERVEAGNPNDYDYLPAVLFSCIDSTKQLNKEIVKQLRITQILTVLLSLAIIATIVFLKK